MENSPTLSWHSRDSLKKDLLAQMQVHYEQADLGSVQIGPESFYLYGWNNEVNYPLCAKMLGLDEGVLHLGFYLWEGFPEDKKGIRNLIQSRMDLLDKIPVGVDLGFVCPEFIVWRLENADFSLNDPQKEHTIKAILEEVLNEFYADKPDMLPLRQKIERAIEDVHTSISTLWQKRQQIDQDFNRTLNALETAAAACTFFTKASAAADTARTYIFGANGTNVRNLEVTIGSMGEKLLLLLQGAVGRR